MLPVSCVSHVTGQAEQHAAIRQLSVCGGRVTRAEACAYSSSEILRRATTEPGRDSSLQYAASVTARLLATKSACQIVARVN